MFEKFKTPHWLEKLLELGKPKVSHSDNNKRAYRTSSHRYFWGIAALFIYFLLGAYLLRADAGSSDNNGIIKLVLGALIVGGMAAFLAPRLNEGLERLLPSGRRKQEERKNKSSHRSSRTSRRSSHSSRPDQSESPPVKTDT
jgi:hypothetical protein